MLKVKIYAIKNPLSGKVFYVGASRRPQQRFLFHCTGGSWNPITRRYKEMKALRLVNVMPELIILCEVDAEIAAAMEKHWIDYYNGIGHNLSQQKTSGYHTKGYQTYLMKEHT